MTFSIYLPTKIVFDRSASDGVQEALLDAGAERILLVTDPILTQQTWLQSIQTGLETGGFTVVPIHEISGTPTVAEVEAGADLARAQQVQAVVAVGGGSVINAAKAMALVLGNEGHYVDYLRGQRQIERACPPLVVVPTTAGSGAEVSRTAQVAAGSDLPKTELRHPFLYPTVAIYDPELTSSLPPDMTAASGVTTLVNAIEAYWGHQANPFSDQMAATALKTTWSFLPRAVSKGDDMTARQAMLLSSLWAGMAMDQSGQGFIHALAGALTAHLHIHYGIACAMVLPHVVRFNLPAVSTVRNQRLKNIVGLEYTADDELLVERLAQFIYYLNLPGQLDAALLPLDEFDWDALAEEVMSQPALQNNPQNVTLSDCRDILALLRG